MGSKHTLPVLFLWTQAALVAAWWGLLALVPESRQLFGFGDWPEMVLFAFALPDAVVLVAGSATTAVGLSRGRPWALHTFAMVVGGALYAQLWCLAAMWLAGGGAMPSATMGLCVVVNAWCFRVVRG
ncbi:MAG: hypothetical protein KDC98_25265 [Planctomycetes bacterium]|nr:hypothetical protein [Planctomycetota bacterium]